MNKRLIAVACGLATSLGVAPASAAIIDVVVPGTASIWLANMPDGATALGDTAPQNSPIAIDLAFATGLPFLTFSVSGQTSCDPDLAAYPLVSPDGGGNALFGCGDTSVGGNLEEFTFGLSGIYGQLQQLVGVFINSSEQQPVPEGLDFISPGTRQFTEFSPLLQQVFFIGDGLVGTGVGDLQRFVVPSGADRLYLGILDQGNYNNVGSLAVGVGSCSDCVVQVPILDTALLVLLGVGLLALLSLEASRKLRPASCG